MTRNTFLMLNIMFWSFAATSDVWTGLTDLIVPGMFAWSDGHMVTFTYWSPGEPDNHEGFNEDCVEMLHQVRGMEEHQLVHCGEMGSFMTLVSSLLQTGRWNGVSCSELNTYICKMPRAHYPAPSVQPTVYGCAQVGPETKHLTYVQASDFIDPEEGKLLADYPVHSRTNSIRNTAQQINKYMAG